MAFKDLFGSAWRYFVTDGVPASGPWKPSKAEITAIGAALDAALSGAIAGATPVDTAAHLPASTGSNRIYIVTSDSTSANNGYWQDTSGGNVILTDLNTALKGTPGLLSAATTPQLDAGTDDTVTVTPAGITYLGLTPSQLALTIANATQISTQGLLNAMSRASTMYALDDFGDAVAFVESSVEIDFSHQYYRSSAAVASAAPLLAGWTYSRSGTGWAKKSDGSLQSFAANAARITDKGMSIEAAATNRFSHPDDLTNAAWTKINAPTITGGQAAPDGTSTAFLIADTSGTLSQGIAQSVTIPASTAPETLSIYMKKAASGAAVMGINLAFAGGTAQSVTIRIAPDTGAVSLLSPAVGAGSISVVLAVEDDGAWWRIIYTYQQNGTNTSVGFTLFPAASAALTGALTFWMPQSETGAVASSPAVGTRPADTWSVVLPSGQPDDVVSVEYGAGGTMDMLRSGLANPLLLNLGASSGGAWVGSFVTRVTVLSAEAALGETKVAFRGQLAASTGEPATMAGGASPAITDSGITASLTGSLVPWTDSRIRYTGAETVVAGTAFPDTGAGRFRNVTYSSDLTSFGGIGGAMEFTHVGTAFEVRQKIFNPGGLLRVWVDGEYSGTAFPAIPGGGDTPGNYNYFKVDFSAINASPVSRQIRIEASSPFFFSGIQVKTGESISAPAANRTLRAIGVGDSFTEATGADHEWNNWLNYTARRLGFRDIWSSGSGGTGWMQTLASPPRIDLLDRFTRDVLTPSADAYFIAMGYNDQGDGNDAAIQTGARAKLQALRAAHPKALIYVLGPWDTAPDGTATGYAGIKAAMQAASAGITGCTFIDMQNVAYAEVGGGNIHPITSGHQTLGNYVADQVQLDLAA